jgi:acyl-CoA thioester hydrolase
MGVAWHGSYMLYLEDAREAFGEKYDLGYLRFFGEGYYAPLVDVQLKYKNPIIYGMHPEIEIVYTPTESAKIVFDYKITDGDTLLATAHTVQVFMDKQYKLVLGNPPFFEEWKKKWL